MIQNSLSRKIGVVCCILGITAIMLAWWGGSVESAIQQPTLTVKKFTGEVFGSTSEKGKFPATVETVLKSGDTIETLPNSSANLQFSEGSTITLGEKTKMDIVMLIREQVTEARKSRVKLLKGRMRAKLSEGHQQEDAAFTIETPNALVDVKFSEPDVEVIYNLEENKTSIFAYTVSVTVINSKTKETITISKENLAVVQDDVISVTPVIKAQRASTPPVSEAQKASLDMVSAFGAINRGMTSPSVPKTYGNAETAADVRLGNSASSASNNTSEEGRRLFELDVTIDAQP